MCCRSVRSSRVAPAQERNPSIILVDYFSYFAVFVLRERWIYTFLFLLCPSLTLESFLQCSLLPQLRLHQSRCPTCAPSAAPAPPSWTQSVFTFATWTSSGSTHLSEWCPTVWETLREPDVRFRIHPRLAAGASAETTTPAPTSATDPGRRQTRRQGGPVHPQQVF